MTSLDVSQTNDNKYQVQNEIKRKKKIIWCMRLVQSYVSVRIWQECLTWHQEDQEWRTRDHMWEGRDISWPSHNSKKSLVEAWLQGFSYVSLFRHIFTLNLIKCDLLFPNSISGYSLISKSHGNHSIICTCTELKDNLVNWKNQE